MNTKKPGRPPKSGDKSLTARIEFRALNDEQVRYSIACKMRGQELSDWIRATLNAAASVLIEKHDDSLLRLKTPKDEGTKESRPRRKT